MHMICSLESLPIAHLIPLFGLFGPHERQAILLAVLPLPMPAEVIAHAPALRPTLAEHHPHILLIRGLFGLIVPRVEAGLRIVIHLFETLSELSK